MARITRRRAIALSLVSALAGAQQTGLAQSSPWPGDKPITIVVPYPAGGSSDVIARLLGRKLADALKVPVLVDNKPGAATYIATDYVRRAPADGHVLLLVDVPFTITPHVMPTASYDPRQFTAVALVGTAAQVLWTDAAQARSVGQLIDDAKRKPGELAMASGGPGTNVHLMLEALQEQAGIRINHVPYKGSVPMLTDIGAGIVAAGFSSLASGQALMKAGRIVPVAVTSPTRDPALPQVPTFAEAGLPGMTGEHWWGLVGPSGMPADVTARLNQAVVGALADAQVQAQLQGFAITPRPGPAGDLGQLIARQSLAWAALARKANVRITP